MRVSKETHLEAGRLWGRLLKGSLLAVVILSVNSIQSYADEVKSEVDAVRVGAVLTDLNVSSLTSQYKEVKTLAATQQNAAVYTQDAVEISSSEIAEAATLKAFINNETNDYYNIYKEHCKNLDVNTATEENLINAYARAGYLYETEKIDVYTFRQILNMLEYSYSQFMVYVSKDSYLQSYMNAYYQHSWDKGVYQDYVSTVLGYGNLGNPYGYNATASGEALLATAYAVGSSWARGESTSYPLRYSQTSFPLYTSVISNQQFTVRPDCTGFCYTVLKELGCQSADAVDDGIFYSGSMVTACEDGTFEADPNLEVIPFAVEELQPGDIMVTSHAKSITSWNSDAPHSSQGHAEIFVGFPDPNNHSTIDVWNWGGRSVVEANWPTNQETYIPERKSPSYKFSYIIRYVGGTNV